MTERFYQDGGASNTKVNPDTGALKVNIEGISGGGGLTYKGSWNADTNTPTIPAADSSNAGWYYVVAVAGNTDIDGISDWEVGDWIISSGVSWQKIDNSENPLINRNTADLRMVSNAIMEKFSVTVVNDGGTLYAELEKEGGGDLPVRFGANEWTLDCTTGAGTGGKARSTALTAGADENTLQGNFLYITEAGGVLTFQSSNVFPAGQTLAWVGSISVFDVTTFDSEGEFTFQRFNDVPYHDDRGIIPEIAEKLRVMGATWSSGCLGQIDITTNVGTLDDIDMTVANGSVYQLHAQLFSGYSLAGATFYILNHPTEPYKRITNLNEIDVDANNNPLQVNNSRYGFEIVGLISSTGVGTNRVGILLPENPDGSVANYASDSGALNDTFNYSVTTVPSELRFIAFRIGRVVLKYTTISGGTFENLVDTTAIQDRRGYQFGISAGGGGGGSFVFNNFTATSNPTVNDDVDAGYSVGSEWINTSTGELYRCVDASSGAAVWNAIFDGKTEGQFADLSLETIADADVIPFEDANAGTGAYSKRRTTAAALKSYIGAPLAGSDDWTLGNVNGNTVYTTTVTVTGAEEGDVAVVNIDDLFGALSGYIIELAAQVTSTDTVTVRLVPSQWFNFGTQTVNVRVFQ